MLVLAQFAFAEYSRSGGYQCDMSHLQRQRANYPNADNPQGFYFTRGESTILDPAVPLSAVRLGEMDGSN